MQLFNRGTSPQSRPAGLRSRLAAAGLAAVCWLAGDAGAASAVGAAPAAQAGRDAYAVHASSAVRSAAAVPSASVRPAPALRPAPAAPPASARSTPQALTSGGVAQAGLAPQADPAPARPLLAFVRAAVDKLARQEPYTAWAEAEPAIYPLGPGTHGWLVQLISGGRRVGYLVVTAGDDGSYVLTEYGAGSDGLPYDPEELRAFAARSGLISNSTIARLTAGYAGILPYWKLESGGSVYYISASANEPELLPWDPGSALKESAASGSAASPDSGRLSGPVTSALLPSCTPLALRRTVPADGDPYGNLLWLAAPKLQPGTGAELAALLKQAPALVFQATGANRLAGGPFLVSGYQLWETAATGGSPAAPPASVSPGGGIAYAAVGPGGRRMLPLAALLAAGTLQAYPAE